MTMPLTQFPKLLDKHDVPMGIVWFFVLLFLAWFWGWEITLRSTVWLTALAVVTVGVIILVRFVGRYIAYRWG